MGSVLSAVFHPFTSAEGVCNLILHVTLIALFIALFFFSYGSLVEGVIVRKQCEDIVESLMGNVRAVLTPDELDRLASSLADGSKHREATAADDDACLRNRRTRSRALRIVMIAAASAAGLVLLLWGVGLLRNRSKFARTVGLTGHQVLDMAMINVIVVTFVAFTEYSFLTFVVRNYRSADPNFVKRQILGALVKYGNDG